MPDTADDKILHHQKKGVIETFVGALMPSARMMGLYKRGHPAIIPITERINSLLAAALGLEITLVVDIKGKVVSVEDTTLAETKDISLFGATLHALGVGQVLFTNRVTKEGVYEFLKVLLLKADEKKSLTSIQQELQKLKIAGLQMSFVVSFVEAGEKAAAGQQPGHLSEEQVQAFTKAETLQDFLLLLLRQNEPLSGKTAESVTALLDNTLNRDGSLEQFQAAMLWDHYDPRIRAYWDRFMLEQKWAPKSRKKGALQKWNKRTVISQAGLFLNSDLAAMQARTIQGKPEAISFALGTIHRVLQKPSVPVQGRLALMAYARVLSELGKDGDIQTLFTEFRKWETPQPLSETVMQILEQKVLSPLLAKNLVLYLNGPAVTTEAVKDIDRLAAVFGARGVPLFLDELRDMPDQANRRRLCALITAVSKRIGIQPLVATLSDPDWFLVRNVVMILGDVKFPGTSESILPALRHEHQKIREETVRSLGKIGDAAAVNALTSFIIRWDKTDEAFIAITALSLQARPGIEEKLIEIYNGKAHYETRIAIATALSRVPSPSSQKFLAKLAKKSFLEMITGANKELRKAARESYEKVKGALKASEKVKGAPKT